MANELRMKSSVNSKAAGGDPKKLAVNLPHDGDKALFSTVIGRANGLSSRKEDAREPGKFYQGLGGYFEVIGHDGERVASKVLYAPGVIHDIIASQFTGDNKVTEVEFAFENFVSKGGTAGFSWEHAFIGDPTSAEAEADPLATLRARLTKTKETPKLPAPAPEKAKGAGKNA